MFQGLITADNTNQKRDNTMETMTCLACKSTVVPKRDVNWWLLILLNVGYLPFYFMGKRQCPLCKGVDFTTRSADFTPASNSVVPVKSSDVSVKHPSTVGIETYDLSDASEVYSDVSRMGLQAMESAYIVATSKTLDTVISRYQFLTGLHAGLINESTTLGYSLHIQRAIDQFKAVRYQTIPEAYQMQLVVEPKSFDLAEFYALSLQGAARRSTEAQTVVIQGLKKEDAKQRRMKKIKSDLDACLVELDEHCCRAISYPAVRARLEAAIAVIESGNVPKLD